MSKYLDNPLVVGGILQAVLLLFQNRLGNSIADFAAIPFSFVFSGVFSSFRRLLGIYVNSRT